MGQLFAVILVAAVIVWILKAAVSRNRLFEIRVTSGGVEIRGSVRGSARSDVREFVEGLHLPSGARIRGYSNNGHVRLGFNRAVPESQRQRIRNFLLLNM
jgi:hypothetical protein